MEQVQGCMSPQTVGLMKRMNMYLLGTQAMQYAEVMNILKSSNHDGYTLKPYKRKGQVLVCPSLAGRVMGTSYTNDQGEFGGFINTKAFKEDMKDSWDNWGGEERYWLCPEGGQFGLMFQGKENSFDNYTVQAGINNSKYTVVDISDLGNSLSMKCQFDLHNATGTRFQVESLRRITALDACPYLTGMIAEINFVGFQSESTITNVGANAWSKQTGALAHWHLGQFLPGERVIVIIPFNQGIFSDPPIREDYFVQFCLNGKMPANRYWLKNGFALFKADGKCRTKIGQNRSRATGLLASYNLDSDEIIMMDYDYYPGLEYASSYWYEQPEPYNGDCISFSAEGPISPKEPNGRCYELEAMSPAMFLSPGQSFTFRTRVFHIRGPRLLIAGICHQHLGPEISMLEAFDRQS